MAGVEDFLRGAAETFERSAEVLKETGGEAHDRGDQVSAAHAVGVAEGLMIAAEALRNAGEVQA